MSRVSRYHPVLVALHWFLALLIVAALALGALVMVKISNTDPKKIEALRSHMIGGSLILLLMLVRLVVRTRTRHPPVASTGNPMLDRLAWASHRMFYIAVVGMAGSGLFMAAQTGLPAVVFGGGGGALPADFWVFPVRTVHYVISRVLMLLIVVHVAGALYHTVVLNDGLLKRMFFGRRVLTEPSDRRPAAHSRCAGDVGERPHAVRNMNLSNVSPWFGRFVILAVACLFAAISLKFVLDPLQAAAGSGIALQSALGYTNTRAGFGGFPLGFAAVLVFCLFSSRRLLPALASIATVAAVILAVRFFGAELDGTLRESARLLIPEVALLAISLAAALMEMKRRRSNESSASGRSEPFGSRPWSTEAGSSRDSSPASKQTT